MGLSFDRSISRYYFDKKGDQDFSEFIGTSIILTGVIFFINSILVYTFADEFSGVLGINRGLVYLLIPFTMINIIGLVFQQIFAPQKKSGIIAKSTIYRLYLGFSLSFVAILLLPFEKYYSLIYGQIAAGLILCIYWAMRIYPYITMKYDFTYTKYITKYSIPLIPYALSSVIIGQFGKIVLGSKVSVSDAGYYSLALTIGSLVGIIVEVANQAWNPYFMEYMNTSKYKQVSREFMIIFKITTIVAFGIGIFGIDLGHLLVTDNYLESMRLIPIFTIGFIFYQIAVMHFRNFGYEKKTIHMSVTVLASGIVNVVLSLLLIPLMGDSGAAWAFALSYGMMAILASLLNIFVVKNHVIKLRILMKPLIISLIFYVTYFLTQSISSHALNLFARLTLLFALAAVYFYKDRVIIKTILLRGFKNER